MLRAASRDLLRDRAPADVLRAQLDQDAEVDPALWRSAAEVGWPGLALPEEYGGAGQGVIELALVAEEIGRAAARGPFLPTALVGQALVRGGSARLRAEVLPSLAEGTAWATWAFAEHRSPWTLDGGHTAARTDAERRGARRRQDGGAGRGRGALAAGDRTARGRTGIVPRRP